MKVAFYVTSHGFGHASRVSALAMEFIKCGIECYIISDRPKFLFPKEGSFCHIIERYTDTGMIQDSWNVPSVEKTFAYLSDFWHRKEQIVEREKIFLEEKKIDLVVVDISYFPILSAKSLDIPVYAITNFDWYFNYVELVDENTDKEIVDIISEIYAIYQLCNKSYILPFSNEKSVKSLPHQIKCGNLAKHTKANKKAVCKEFDIDINKNLALITFGGIMSDISYFQKLTARDDYVFLTNSPIGNANNVILLPRDCDYSLLISSCDLVITKVGYSTLAETCAAGTYLCYATRDNFPEDEPLVAGLANYPHKQHFHLLDDSIDIELPVGKIDKYKGDSYSLKNSEIALDMISSFLQENYQNLEAIIDFGTNNSTLILYSSNAESFKIAHYDIRVTGIGLNIEDGLINKNSCQKAKRELTTQLELCKKLGLIPKVLVTNIGRVALNFDQFQKAINLSFNVEWEIISGEREAILGVKSSLFWAAKTRNFYNVDIGGSSTEISLIKDEEVVKISSLDCGILTYYHKFRASRLNFEQISELIQQDIEEKLHELSFPIKQSHNLCGIGKVFQNLTCIYDGKSNYEPFSEIKKFPLQKFMFNLHNIINHKSKYNYHDYNGKKLDETIFYISLGILQALNNILDTKELIVNPWGLEFGYLLEKRSKNNEI